ncbi:MAG: CpsD/CapB family tyrosine-protein kinase [Methylococcales bacterium]|nr:CpsD/CapB family tyrosine-protein kinase [Methylococcales bacterium]
MKTDSKSLPMSDDILKQRRIVAMQNNTLEINTFKILRTKILKKLKDNQWTSFAITAPTKNSGKTMVAVNLAMVMAMELNQTILLVDMNLRNPKIHHYFDLEVTLGVKDFLVSDTSLEDILITPQIDRLAVLPGRGQISNSSEMMTAPKMQRLVRELKNIYHPQITLFDLPPILGSDDVLASIDYYDAMLLVIEEGGNTAEEVKNSLKMLSEVSLLGTVLNKSESIPSHYHDYL